MVPFVPGASAPSEAPSTSTSLEKGQTVWMYADEDRWVEREVLAVNTKTFNIKGRSYVPLSEEGVSWSPQKPAQSDPSPIELSDGDDEEEAISLDLSAWVTQDATLEPARARIVHTRASPRAPTMHPPWRPSDPPRLQTTAFGRFCCAAVPCALKSRIGRPPPP